MVLRRARSPELMFPPLVACTRFSDATIAENHRWRDRNDYEGCIYGVSRPIKESINHGAWMYVIEMNNTGRGRIEGIGLIRNINRNRKKHTIYSDRNYNLEIYGGKYRLSREELLGHSGWSRTPPRPRHRPVKLVVVSPFTKVPREGSLLCKLEDRLFRGKGHLKRGWGITLLPPAITRCPELAVAHNIALSFKHKYAQTPE